MPRINKSNKSQPVIADSVLIYDSEDTSDDKSITLGQIASLVETQNSTVAGTKIFADGVEFQKGNISYGQYTPFPSGVGTYVASYVSPTYGARLLGYNGSSYQDLSIGSMPTAGTPSIKSLANGDCNFGYNTNISGNCTATKFYGDGSELDGIVSGVSEFDNKGTVTTNITLVENKITTGYWNGTNTITLPTITDTTKQVVCILDFTTASTSQPTITDTNIKWSSRNSGKAPSSYSIISGVHNVFTFKSIWEGSTLYWEVEYDTYGGVETSFVQPTLSADGTLGGSSFAVYSSSVYDVAYAWKAADNNTGTQFNAAVGSGWYYEWYNPNALKVSSIDIKNVTDTTRAITGYTIYGSNDNNNWVPLYSGSNAVTSAGVVWNIPVNSSEFYKYHKMYVSAYSGSDAYTGMNQATLNAVYIAT